MIGGLGFLLMVAGLSVTGAADRDEAVLTVEVSSAAHEIEEGYFSLGPETTLIAKPGSDLQRFLTRQNGRKVRVSVTPLVDDQRLSRLER
jgi:hypothetical protein